MIDQGRHPHRANAALSRDAVEAGVEASSYAACLRQR
jgi:hypothetical protein